MFRMCLAKKGMVVMLSLASPLLEGFALAQKYFMHVLDMSHAHPVDASHMSSGCVSHVFWQV